MIRPFLALVALMTVVGSVRPADDDLPGPKIEWPKVEGLDRQKVNKFKDSALGYSVSYVGDGLVVTVFIYNLGLEKIPTGPNSDAIKAEMYESAVALEANKANGRYKSIQPLDDAVIAFGSNAAAPKLRRKRYEIEITKEGPALTELYVTGYKNYFIKLRATYPTDNKEKCQKRLDELIDELGQGLK